MAMSDGAFTAQDQDVTAAATTNTGSEEQAGLKTMLTVKTSAGAFDPQRRPQTLISPTPTPRASRFLGAIISSDDEADEDNLLFPTQANSLGRELPTRTPTPTKVRFAVQA